MVVDGGSGGSNDIKYITSQDSHERGFFLKERRDDVNREQGEQAV